MTEEFDITGLKNYLDITKDAFFSSVKLSKNKKNIKLPSLTNEQKKRWMEIRKELQFFFNNTKQTAKAKFKNVIKQNYFIEGYQIFKDENFPLTKLPKLSIWGLMVASAILRKSKTEVLKLAEDDELDYIIDIFSHLVEYYKKTTGLGRKIDKGNFEDVLTAIASLRPAVYDMALKGEIDLFKEERKFVSAAGEDDPPSTEPIEISFGHPDKTNFATHYTIAMRELKDEGFKNTPDTKEKKPDELTEQAIQEALNDPTPPVERPTAAASRTAAETPYFNALASTSTATVPYFNALASTSTAAVPINTEEPRRLPVPALPNKDKTLYFNNFDKYPFDDFNYNGLADPLALSLFDVGFVKYNGLIN